MKNTFEERIRRRAISMEIGGFEPSEDPCSSWFGKVNLRGINEKWPRGKDDKPMWPLAQINVSELPFVPKRMDDFQFLAVFVDPNLATSDCCVRTYASFDELVPFPLEIASGLQSHVKPFPMRPKIVEADYPTLDDLPEKRPLEFKRNYHQHFPNVSGFKLGGWPTLIQSEITWGPVNTNPAKPEYVFQIDSTQKGHWSWAHDGVGYFGRGTTPGYENEWVLDWQCL